MLHAAHGAKPGFQAVRERYESICMDEANEALYPFRPRPVLRHDEGQYVTEPGDVELFLRASSPAVAKTSLRLMKP